MTEQQYTQDTEYTGLTEEQPQPPKKSKKKIIMIAAIALAAILLVVVIAGLLTNWFGLTGPMAELSRAFKKTASAKSMTLVDGGGEGEAYILLNGKKHEFTIYQENEYESWDGKKTKYIDLMTHEGSWYASYQDGVLGYGYGYEADDDETEPVFDIYDYLVKGKEIDLEDLLDEMFFYGDLDEYVDTDKLDAFVSTFTKKYLNNETWMKKYMGYEKKSKNGVTVYSFEPEWDDLLEEIFDIMKEEKLLEDDGEDALEYLIDNFDNDLEFSLSISVKGGYIVGFELEMPYNDIDIEIENINKTKLPMDDDEIEKFKEEIEDYEINRYY